MLKAIRRLIDALRWRRRRREREERRALRASAARWERRQ
jgi:hypothetical protein